MRNLQIQLVFKSFEHLNYFVPPNQSCRIQESEDLTHFQKADLGHCPCGKDLLYNGTSKSSKRWTLRAETHERKSGSDKNHDPGQKDRLLLR